MCPPWSPVIFFAILEFASRVTMDPTTLELRKVMYVIQKMEKMREHIKMAKYVCLVWPQSAWSPVQFSGPNPGMVLRSTPSKDPFPHNTMSWVRFLKPSSSFSLNLIELPRT